MGKLPVDKIIIQSFRTYDFSLKFSSNKIFVEALIKTKSVCTSDAGRLAIHQVLFEYSNKFRFAHEKSIFRSPARTSTSVFRSGFAAAFLMQHKYPILILIYLLKHCCSRVGNEHTNSISAGRQQSGVAA